MIADCNSFFLFNLPWEDGLP